MRSKRPYPFPKAIIFDWDNTLVDSFPVVYDAMKKTYDTFGKRAPTRDELYHCKGFSLRDSFPAVFGDAWEEAKKIYLTAFEEMHLTRVKPFDNAEALLSYAAEHVGALAVLSNKTGRILRDEAAFFGWTSYFSALVGSLDAPVDKPAGEAAQFALKNTDIVFDADGKVADVVWFVGDGAVDVMCARAVGAFPVHVGDVDGFDDVPCCLKGCGDVLEMLKSYEK